MKKFAFMAAILFVGFAQTASAQQIPNGAHTITIKYLSWVKTGNDIPYSGSDESVTSTTNLAYFFSTVGSVITIGGKRMPYISLKTGMNCTVNGALNISKGNRYYITTLAC